MTLKSVAVSPGRPRAREVNLSVRGYGSCPALGSSHCPFPSDSAPGSVSGVLPSASGGLGMLAASVGPAVT